MNICELPEGIEIQRDFERENMGKQNFNPINLSDYTFYKILLNSKETGFASYRLRGANWYIDCFFIDENYRKKRLGTYLIKHIIKEMREQKNICIKIHPGKRQDLIMFLIKNNFKERDGDYLLSVESER